jgi:hypothetical protein
MYMYVQPTFGAEVEMLYGVLHREGLFVTFLNIYSSL